MNDTPESPPGKPRYRSPRSRRHSPPNVPIDSSKDCPRCFDSPKESPEVRIPLPRQGPSGYLGSRATSGSFRTTQGYELTVDRQWREALREYRRKYHVDPLGPVG
jgi:hypothetical protein